jgi:hypothetical protein
MRAIDRLVDELLLRMKVRYQCLPEGERARWFEVVREEVQRHPEMARLF